MHAARPILVTYNGYKSIINEANCGWFIPANNPQLMADKILAISKMDKTYLSKIGLNGREYLIKHHDYKVLAEKLYNYINE
jgi:glycosyltransferase involved in cell wall biosynthesis